MLAALKASDRRLALWLTGWSPPRGPAAVLHAFSALGEGWIWLLGGLVQLTTSHPARALATVVVTAAFVNALVVALKGHFRRSRPGAYVENRLLAACVGAPALDRFSFPSGHAANACALAVLLARGFPGLALPIAAVATAVGASRLALCYHYMSDTLAGALLGLTVGGGIVALMAV
jgi:undecaprenyl-diphosphatase